MCMYEEWIEEKIEKAEEQGTRKDKVMKYKIREDGSMQLMTNEAKNRQKHKDYNSIEDKKHSLLKETTETKSSDDESREEENTEEREGSETIMSKYEIWIKERIREAQEKGKNAEIDEDEEKSSCGETVVISSEDELWESSEEENDEDIERKKGRQIVIQKYEEWMKKLTKETTNVQEKILRKRYCEEATNEENIKEIKRQKKTVPMTHQFKEELDEKRIEDTQERIRNEESQGKNSSIGEVEGHGNEYWECIPEESNEEIDVSKKERMKNARIHEMKLQARNSKFPCKEILKEENLSTNEIDSDQEVYEHLNEEPAERKECDNLNVVVRKHEVWIQEQNVDI